MAISPVSISIADSSFSSFVDSVYPPNADDAAYLGIYGGDDASALENLVTGAAATKIGTITHGTHHTNMDRGNGIDTGVAFTSPFTFYAVCGRVPSGSASGQGIMGCFNNSDGTYRQSLLADTFNGTSGTIGLFINYVTGQRYAPTSPGLGASNYNFIFAQFDGATMQCGYGYEDGGGNEQIAKAATAYAYSPTSKNLRIGATGYGNTVGLLVPYAAAAAYPSVLTVDQLLEEYAFHKARMASIGLTLN